MEHLSEEDKHALRRLYQYYGGAVIVQQVKTWGKQNLRDALSQDSRDSIRKQAEYNRSLGQAEHGFGLRETQDER